ncbi:MAG: hypothetical protein IH972_00405, partial [Candidatus Marinimicrobia bacterium]|nr:hypothetical protein [Candidatus Neomarinimicrobiota bacterium]
MLLPDLVAQQGLVARVLPQPQVREPVVAQPEEPIRQLADRPGLVAQQGLE